MRRLSMVCLKTKNEPQAKPTGPFKFNAPYIYMGEIPNMKGHGIFVDYHKGTIFSGYHIDQFREMTEAET